MPGEFLREKWTRVFVEDDMDGDGFLTIDDAKIFIDRFTEHHKMTGEMAKEVKENFEDIWRALFLFGKEKIDLSEYLEKMADEYTNNNTKFFRRIFNAVDDLTKLYDFNKDGFVSIEELKVAEKCWGLTNVDVAYVHGYPEVKPGFIGNDVFRDSWVEFFMNDDRDKIDFEKPCLYGFGMITMAGNFLHKKWRTIFEANDVNKDGAVTLEDANLFATRFSKHHRMPKERAAQLKADFRAFWDSMFVHGQDKMEPDEFVEKMAQEYEDNKGAFARRMYKILSECVDLFDVNNDGLISSDEYIVAMRSWGIDKFDADFIGDFAQFMPGYIDKALFRDAWVAYFTNDDSGKVDLETPVLRALQLI